MLQVHFNHPAYGDAAIRESLEGILSHNTELAMATVNGRESHINTAHFAYNGQLELFIFTSPQAEHSLNLEANPSIAVAIWHTPSAWSSDLQGVQLFGTASMAPREQWDEARRLYTERFPGFRSVVRSRDDLDRVPLRFYRIEVDWVKVLDEPRFGKKQYVIADVVRQPVPRPQPVEQPAPLL